MKFVILLFYCAVFFSCRIGGDRNFPFFPKGDNADELDKYENFTICYRQGNFEREQGFIGTIGEKKFFYEVWTVPSIREMTVKYLFLRTDTSEVNDFDFCVQEIPLNENFDKYFILMFKKNKGNYSIDTSLTLYQVPTYIQPLILYLNGWQNFNHFNRGGKYDPEIFIKDDILHIDYYKFDAASNKIFEKTAYHYNGKTFDNISIKEPLPSMYGENEQDSSLNTTD